MPLLCLLDFFVWRSVVLTVSFQLFVSRDLTQSSHFERRIYKGNPIITIQLFASYPYKSTVSCIPVLNLRLNGKMFGLFFIQSFC